MINIFYVKLIGGGEFKCEIDQSAQNYSCASPLFLTRLLEKT